MAIGISTLLQSLQHQAKLIIVFRLFFSGWGLCNIICSPPSTSGDKGARSQKINVVYSSGAPTVFKKCLFFELCLNYK